MIGDKQKHTKGFTLVEVLVASSLLIIIVVVAANVYLTSLSSQRRTFAKQNALDSTRFALESMGRAIRQSTITDVTADSLTIEHPDPKKGTIVYSVSNDRLVETSGGTTQPITSNDVVVQDLSFYSLGVGAGNGHPRLTLVLVVRSSNAKPSEESRVRLQTTIAPRVIEQ